MGLLSIFAQLKVVNSVNHIKYIFTEEKKTLRIKSIY